MTESGLHLCGTHIYSSTWKRFQNLCEWSACFHGAFSLWCRQWLVKTVTFETETKTWLKLRDWDFIKNPEIETWNSRPRLRASKFVHFVERFFLMSSSRLG